MPPVPPPDPPLYYVGLDVSQFLLADIPSLSGSATVFGLLRMPTVAITGILVVAGSAAIGFTNPVLSLILEESVRITITRFELIQTPLEGSHRMTITRFERIQTPLERAHRISFSSLSQCTGTIK